MVSRLVRGGRGDGKWRWVGALLSLGAVGLLALILSRGEWAEPLERLSGVRPLWLVLALLLGLGVEVAKALRWQLLLGAEAAALPGLLATLLGSRVMNALAPLRAGDLWRVASAAGGEGRPLAVAGGSVVVEKLLDGCILGLAGLALVWSGAPDFPAGPLLPAVALAGLAAAAALAVRKGVGAGLLRRSGAPELWGRRRVLPGALGLSVAGMGLGLAVNLAVLEALGQPVGLAPGTAMLVSAYAVGLVPALPGQIGVFELAVSAALMGVGFPAPSAVTASLALHLVLLALLALGGVLALPLRLVGRSREVAR